MKYTIAGLFVLLYWTGHIELAFVILALSVIGYLQHKIESLKKKKG